MNGTEKNGKQRVPSEKRSSYKNGLGRKNGKRIDPKRKGHLRKTNGTEKMGSKRPKKKGEQKKNIGTKTTGNKQFQVKHWHLTTMDWDQNMASKRSTEETGIQKNNE